MRQVDLDELTYHLFSGLRAWTASHRARIFAPIAKRRDVHRKIAAQALAERMARWIILDPTALTRPVDIPQLEAVLTAAIDAFPGAIAGLWRSGQQDREREARTGAAILLAQALDPFEILTETTLDPHGARVVSFPNLIAPPHVFSASWP